MNTAASTNSTTGAAFARAADPLLNLLSNDQMAQIAQYHTDDALQERIEELAQKANEGDLTVEEQAEYEGYIRANRFIAVFQAQARRKQASAAVD